jgi:uncharacterized protein (DUF1330 family)
MRASLKIVVAAVAGTAAGIAGVGVARGAAPPRAFIVAEINVTDAAAYRPYAEQAAKLVAKYGGHYLARGGATKSIEGEAPPNRVAIIEFPSMEALDQFESSPDYTAVKPIRQRASTGRIFAVQGVAP